MDHIPRSPQCPEWKLRCKIPQLIHFLGIVKLFVEDHSLGYNTKRQHMFAHLCHTPSTHQGLSRRKISWSLEAVRFGFRLLQSLGSSAGDMPVKFQSDSFIVTSNPRWIPRTKASDVDLWSLICVWINGWVNNREAGDLRRHRAHYDVTVMGQKLGDGSASMMRSRHLISNTNFIADLWPRRNHPGNYKRSISFNWYIWNKIKQIN